VSVVSPCRRGDWLPFWSCCWSTSRSGRFVAERGVRQPAFDESGATTRYRTIVADPPWPYPEGFFSINRTIGKWSEKVKKPLPYPSMNLDEIATLPLGDLAAKDCNLFCWTTNRYLPETFSIIEGWGFRYSQTIVWHKLNGPPFGGSIAPNAAEYLLLARRGSAGFTGRLDSSVVSIRHNAKAHSRKPEAFLDLIEQVSPAPRLEMFARRQRLGWDTWGNQALEHVEVAS